MTNSNVTLYFLSTILMECYVQLSLLKRAVVMTQYSIKSRDILHLSRVFILVHPEYIV
jgi:hypothetical protein